MLWPLSAQASHQPTAEVKAWTLALFTSFVLELFFSDFSPKLKYMFIIEDLENK